MRITLTVTAGPHKDRVFTFAGHDTFLVGRSQRAHFRLSTKDRYFSRIHFLVEVNPPECALMDMGSRNGTYVNGTRVERCYLRNGDAIRAGHSILRVTVEEGTTEMPAIPATLTEPPRKLATSLPPPLPSIAAQTRQAEEITSPEFSLPPPPPAPAPSVLEAALCRLCGEPLAALPVSFGPSLPMVCQACQEAIRGQPQTIPGYHLARELGRGAMGVVALALHEATGRAVAIKTIKPAVAGSKTQVERFLREANILRELEHPHVVRFLELGEASGVLFFAMEYVRGADAARLLKTSGPFPVGRAVRLVRQALEGLGYAHARRFVHRDVKPSNMLVAGEGGAEQVRLADFGLGRVYQASHMSGLTMTGDMGGTMAFMPPEQITEYREAKPPADQYSAAATLYNLLTGAYVHDLPQQFQRQVLKILHEDAVPIRDRRRDLPKGLAEVVHRALKREPKDRWPDVAAFREALRPFES